MKGKFLYFRIKDHDKLEQWPFTASKFRYQETCGTISSEKLKYSLTNSLLCNIKHSREPKMILFMFHGLILTLYGMGGGVESTPLGGFSSTVPKRLALES